jgi:hypothetical protein
MKCHFILNENLWLAKNQINDSLKEKVAITPLFIFAIRFIKDTPKRYPVQL